MEKNDFVTVAELAVGFSEYALNPTDEWVTKPLTLDTAQGLKFEIHCFDLHTARIQLFMPDQQNYVFSSDYNILKINEKIQFLDFLIPSHILPEGRTISVSIAMNVVEQFATIIWGQLPEKNEYDLSTFYRASQNLPITAVKVEFFPAAINQAWSSSTAQHQLTEQLVGRKIQFKYSENDLYQHTYLNKDFYTWECLKGVEEGLCETDKCYYYLLDQNVFLFVWIEKIIPTLGIVIEDLNSHRSHGKIFGYAGYESGQVSNFLVGSYAQEMP
ncbi:hypothetical protein QE380_000637 [Acinetobacter baylyi]|uniref:Molybdenum cofactor biosynthesis protein F n=1 Tax=Acinetobacter baylyi TaxID=202950 RepID=A0ABU0UT37_ACIBI|nr:MoaF C-terminal domain-containing protein [Acinetobacter baylyi]MDQ1207714.1 hypothetical protein [Acinetobacter baylyi]MDR6105209.1 hypothetical protein [Acinetobacter baylyi]MDR6184584.1 hypothetical protein [Acinetobacter baylyi]